MVGNKSKYFVVIVLIVGMMWPVSAYASQRDPIPIRLIATMSYQDEYKGLLHLGFLDTKVLTVEDFNEAAKLVESSAVTIEAGNYSGSGSIFEMSDDRIILVSCRHLLQYDETPSVTFSDQGLAEGKVIYLSEQADLGFVLIDPAEIPIKTLRNCRKIAKREAEPKPIEENTKIFHIGSGNQDSRETYQGEVIDPWKFFPEFNTFMIHSNCKGEPGMSGGGTFDLQGYYIGMILGGKNEETASLPLSLIEEEWNIALRQSSY